MENANLLKEKEGYTAP